MRVLSILLLFSSTAICQGNFGINFGINDDNFGSITDLKNKIENYNLDIKNSTGFQFGVFSEIDLITFYRIPFAGNLKLMALIGGFSTFWNPNIINHIFYILWWRVGNSAHYRGD